MTHPTNEICKVCGGVGESTIQIEDEEFETRTCEACFGRGLRLSRHYRSSTYEQLAYAMQAAYGAAERHYARL